MEGYLTEIREFGPTWAPRNWATCSGQTMPISSFNAVFSLIGTIYGGDGRTTFRLPDLRGRTAVGSGAGIGLSPRPNGSAGGVETVILTTAQMPSHYHPATASSSASSVAGVSVSASGGGGTSGDPTNNYWAAGGLGTDIYAPTSNTTMNAGAVDVAGLTVNTQVTINSSGGNLDHYNMQPWLCVGYIICLSGIYPSRN